MSKELDKFSMGAKARDVLTGFEGVIVCKTEWLTGCDQIGIKPTELDKDGKSRDAEYFDITRVQVIDEPTEQMGRVVDGKLQLKGRSKKQSGGPQERVRRGR